MKIVDMNTSIKNPLFFSHFPANVSEKAFIKT